MYTTERAVAEKACRNPTENHLGAVLSKKHRLIPLKMINSIKSGGTAVGQTAPNAADTAFGDLFF